MGRAHVVSCWPVCCSCSCSCWPQFLIKSRTSRGANESSAHSQSATDRIPSTFYLLQRRRLDGTLAQSAFRSIRLKALHLCFPGLTRRFRRAKWVRCRSMATAGFPLKRRIAGQSSSRRGHDPASGMDASCGLAGTEPSNRVLRLKCILLYAGKETSKRVEFCG